MGHFRPGNARKTDNQGEAGKQARDERRAGAPLPARHPQTSNTGEALMNAEYQVQKAGLAGKHWTTICRGPEAKAREIFHRQLRLYSVGRFRLLDASGRVIEEQTALALFSAN